jgi:hypothetical protein
MISVGGVAPRPSMQRELRFAERGLRAASSPQALPHRFTAFGVMTYARKPRRGVTDGVNALVYVPRSGAPEASGTL